MKFYYGNKIDGKFAVYEKDGKYYPVFVEAYGTDPVEVVEPLTEVTDPDSVLALQKYMKPYEDNKPTIYMAGPLFNEGDRYTNQVNSDKLRALGYTTFLPQEVVITNDSSELVKAACYYMDFKAIDQAEYMVCNCNGIEIDSGTAAEIGLGYGLHKKLILYKSDVRNYYNDTYKLNNFVGGLVNNEVCRTFDEVVEKLKTI